MQLSWHIYIGSPGGLELLPHTPAAHLIISSSSDTLVCSPLAVVDSWPASASVTFFACMYFHSSFDPTALLLDSSGVGAPPSPSSSSRHATRPQLHLGPSVSHPPASPLKPQLTLRWATIPLQLTHSLSLHLCLPPSSVLPTPLWAPRLHQLTTARAWDSCLCPALELVE